jgi:anaerobic selenocysteine-containing dehydrogenase
LAGEKAVYSFCRICTGQCATVLKVDENDRITDIRGDQEHPQSLGYACFKGLQAVEAHYGPQRILHPLKRIPNGEFERIPLETALDEIADRLRLIIDEHGGEAVAGYKGSGAYYNAAAAPILQDWLRAVGSLKLFTSLTIDQSAKVVAMGRMGIWPPGKNPLSAPIRWFRSRRTASIRATSPSACANASSRAAS